jgi:predicted metal-dependent hydrolase
MMEPSVSPPVRAERRPAITPRAPSFDLSDLPRHWFFGSPALTHLANGVNLLFPAGERMFVRAVRRFADGLEPELAAQVKGFGGQEGRHAQAHERVFDALREQGFEIDRFLARYERVAYGLLEKAAPAELKLATTVALEHFTAILAEEALTSGVLEGAHPAMRQLLAWHAVEELEHKAVAFDVLAAKRPSYAWRMAGLAMATSTLGVFWLLATKELLAQDGMTLGDAAREMKKLRKMAAKAGISRRGSVVTRVFLRGIREFARPDFHPFDRDHRAVVEKALDRLAREGVL